MIELNSLSCKYGEKNILKNVSLIINEHLSVLGANGSGKSTLAKAICGLLEFEGEILIDAKNVKELSLIERAKLLSYIPAKLEIYDQFVTVEEFVLLGRFPYKKSFFEYGKEDKRIASETLEFLKIQRLKERFVGSLSSGEQQLVLIAQALTQQSKIIIFDEPTANLDPHNSKVIAQRIKELKKRCQVVLITHDLNLASYVDSPVLFIKDAEALSYERDFFDDATLKELYGVEFDALAIRYD